MNSTEYDEMVSKLVRNMTNSPDLIHLGTVKRGLNNKWCGVSGFYHQIDVSLENEREVLLVECKYWKRNVTAQSLLTLLARVIDIAKGPDSKDRLVRGALVTSRGFQRGVDKLGKYYNRCLSTFEVSSDGEFKIKSHTHFIDVQSISSCEKVGIPTIIQNTPASS